MARSTWTTWRRHRGKHPTLEALSFLGPVKSDVSEGVEERLPRHKATLRSTKVEPKIRAHHLPPSLPKNCVESAAAKPQASINAESFLASSSKAGYLLELLEVAVGVLNDRFSACGDHTLVATYRSKSSL